MTNSEVPADRIAADAVYGKMRHLIDTMSSVPGEFSLEELAGVAVASADHDTLVRMAMDMLLHKGRQHCGGKVRRPEIVSDGVVSDESRGRFPRAVPVDRRGTSTWVGWNFSDSNQRYDAAQRRLAQASGLDVEATRIRAEIDRQNAEVVRMHTRRLTVEINDRARNALIDETIETINAQMQLGSVSVDRNVQTPDWRVEERPWEGGTWLTGGRTTP
jgi:hypothetical protein